MTYDYTSKVYDYNSSYGAIQVRVYSYAKAIWDVLYREIQNAYGVSALMGNFQGESNNCPFSLQGDVPPSKVSADYSTSIDNGEVSKETFIKDGKGYSLAQWTFYSRKSAYWDFWKAKGGGIGDAAVGAGFALKELNDSYSDVLTVLKNATDIRTASDYVLHNYEQPSDQSEAVEKLRAGYGEFYYSIYAGTPPEPPTPTERKRNFFTIYLRNNFYKFSS